MIPVSQLSTVAGQSERDRRQAEERLARLVARWTRRRRRPRVRR
ncbi:MAG: hypothetical protein QOI78_2655 [Actinomycetota bacterium]|jgi:hypothetical protein|nr:hypothetical protein [Actinomycetota bacterium]